MNRIDNNMRVSSLTLGAGKWFGLRLDLMAACFSFFISIISIIYRDKINSSLVALSLLYSISMTSSLQWGVRQLLEVEALMASAERINEYGKLAPEEDGGGPKRLINTSSDWPNQGSIEFRDYSLRYRLGLEPALKHISFKIRPGEKIGVIGRTGQKHSLYTYTIL